MPAIKPIKVFREPPGRPTHEVDELAAHLNLGPKSAAWLRAAGIKSPDQIRKLGVIESCRRVRATGHPVSVVLAYALEGALTGCHWNSIPLETKQWLRFEFAQMKNAEVPSTRAKRKNCLRPLALKSKRLRGPNEIFVLSLSQLFGMKPELFGSM